MRTNAFDGSQEFAEWEYFEDDDDETIGDIAFDELVAGYERASESEVLALAEQAYGLLAQTPELTASEQAELLRAVAENGRPLGDRREIRGERLSEDVDFGRIAQAIQQGLQVAGGLANTFGGGRQAPQTGGGRRSQGFDYGRLAQGIQQGLQLAGGLAGTFGGRSRTAQTFSRWANRLGQGAGQLGGMLQALRGGQIPALPGAGGRAGQVPAGGPTTLARSPSAGTGAAGRPQLNATGLFALLANNPQLMSQITRAIGSARGGARRVEVYVPTRGRVSIPLTSVMNMFAELAQASMLELGEVTSENDPEVSEYLIGDDGELLVDPESNEDSAALVLHLMRLQGEAQRYGYSDPEGLDAFEETGWADTDESELWAREAGFDD